MTVRGRARSGAEKAERRMALLAAALELLEERSGEPASVADVARRAQVAKGTLYLYFPSSEALHLALLEEQVHSWLDAWAQELPEPGKSYRPAPASLAVTFARTALRRPLLLPLAALGTSVLEPGLDAATGHRFRLGLARHIDLLGARLAPLLPGLDASLASDLVRRSYALLLGLWQLLSPARGTGKVLDREELAGLRHELGRHAEEALAALWRGSLAGGA